MKRNMMMTELTVPAKAEEMIWVNTGRITMKEWLEREKARIEKDPDRTAVIVKKDGEISLWVDRVASAENSVNKKDKRLEELV